ncbi:MAG TPA: hypothetical protein VMW80_12800 [Candidatus Dormibacteraeota bacterium]|nr:hypothetical protein [Candidatus Dormibacteraeota bacterium]
MQDAQQAEYQAEIAELQRKLIELQENEAAPTLIEEYSAEVKILTALLEATQELQEQVASRPELAENLLAGGFQADHFKDLYAYVYERALEIEAAGGEFALAIRRTDFGALLSG